MLRRLLWIPTGICLLLGIWILACSIVYYPVSSRLPRFTTESTAVPSIPSDFSSSDSLNQLPALLPGTELLIEALVTYEGPFFEDFSDEEAITAGIILKNNSSQTVTFARVEGMSADRILTFDITYLPPGERVLIPEKNRNPIPSSPVQWNCKTVSTEPGTLWEPEFRICDVGPCSFSVTNHTEQDISQIAIYYKQYAPQQNMYIGGITYCAVLSDLASQETRKTSPCHFTQGHSKIVMIKKTQA